MKRKKQQEGNLIIITAVFALFVLLGIGFGYVFFYSEAEDNNNAFKEIVNLQLQDAQRDEYILDALCNKGDDYDNFNCFAKTQDNNAYHFYEFRCFDKPIILKEKSRRCPLLIFCCFLNSPLRQEVKR